jgi:predicted TIM-barrel fold metal-dependent hydrolase
MILDANAFIGKWPYWPVTVSTPGDVIAELQSIKMDCGAICSTRSVFVNWEDGNVEVEAAAKESSGGLIPFACLGTKELSHEFHEAEYDFDGYAKRGFRGIRLYPQHHSYHLLFSKFVDVILEDSASRGWPVLLPLRIIMNWGVPSIAPEAIHGIVTRHPNVNWILAGINYLFELQMATSLMLRHENVALETSCVMGYAAVEKTVQQCGHEQVLFGSGAPLQQAAASLAKITHAKISDSAKEALLGKNFERMLGVQVR